MDEKITAMVPFIREVKDRVSFNFDFKAEDISEEAEQHNTRRAEIWMYISSKILRVQDLMVF